MLRLTLISFRAEFLFFFLFSFILEFSSYSLACSPCSGDSIESSKRFINILLTLKAQSSYVFPVLCSLWNLLEFLDPRKLFSQLYPRLSLCTCSLCVGSEDPLQILRSFWYEAHFSLIPFSSKSRDVTSPNSDWLCFLQTASYHSAGAPGPCAEG